MAAGRRCGGALPASPSASDHRGLGWFEGSALDLPFPAGSYDVVLCQLGLQFFPDQPAALASLLSQRAEGPARHLAQALIGEVAAALQARQADDGLAFPQEAHVLLAST